MKLPVPVSIELGEELDHDAYRMLVPNVYNESETITKFEIMDGAPVRGTCTCM